MFTAHNFILTSSDKLFSRFQCPDHIILRAGQNGGRALDGLQFTSPVSGIQRGELGYENVQEIANILGFCVWLQ